jgi:hypothetical protein
MIYEYAYGGMIIRAFTNDKYYPVYEKGSWSLLPFSANDFLASTMVCRQMHSEIGLIPILCNELWFKDAAKMSKKLSEFAPKWRGRLKSVRLSAVNFASAINLIKKLEKDAAVTEHLKGVDFVLVTTEKGLDKPITEPYRLRCRLMIERKLGRKVKIEFD